MGCTLLIGAQWGDEGKGKIVDVLAEEADVIVRYQGGNNAGHTIEIGAERYVLHLVPSGILHAGKTCVIGNGLVVDPCALWAEIKDLEKRGIAAAGRLLLSDRAHLVLAYHRLQDDVREGRAGHDQKIGTTRRGIGPAYADKANRSGLRAGDMLAPGFAGMVMDRIRANNRLLVAMGAEPLDSTAVQTQILEAAVGLKPYIADTVLALNQAHRAGKKILLEGAQGTMLDIDFGTYPFVTSSNASAGGACTGTGLPPASIDRVIGVLKAYVTRVGEGPFPTELKEETGAYLREQGHEFGATTGRPRRCGWFDAVVARYAAMLSGIDFWAITKLDVLDRLPTIRLCTAYELDGRRLPSLPASIRDLERCRPVYEEFPGWNTSTEAIGRFEDLPARAKAYVQRLCDITGVPVGILSVGPRRDSTFRLIG